MRGWCLRWGRLSRDLHDVVDLDEVSSAGRRIAGSRQPGLPFGNGRSYGDVCLNADGVLWATRGLDRFLAFDDRTGVIECEAGVRLKEVIDLALPHGWFPAVTPGTQWVTVGGAVANDVHGKNHHRNGCFGDHVESLTLLRTDGSRIVCGPDVESGWFRATVGGMGLTGLIVHVTFRLRPVAGPWIECERHAFQSLERFFALSDASINDWEYSVSWIDCGTLRGGEPRGIFFAGNHAASRAQAPTQRSRRVPFTPPVPLVNRLSMRAFNSLYYRVNQAGTERSTKHYRPFFYPLDALLEWNRIYGPRGFYQFQCVVPQANQEAAVRELLQAIAVSGEGSFLSVLKTFSARPAVGMLSFPMAGTTLALDFPNFGPPTLALLQRLCAIVDAAGGRLYPAKDAFMPPDLLLHGYPEWQHFSHFRDPGISSQMSRRLVGH
jgi:FAD/FMN-containing dehydrogenase